MRGKSAAALLSVALAAPAVISCSSAEEPTPAVGESVSGSLTVLAAASLTETFTAIGEQFELANPGTTVTFSFAGSSTLATQINQGAPADVFASASESTMDDVVEAGNIEGTPVTIATNQLVIAVPTGNPLGIGSLADLAKPGVTVALCAEQVPCGAAAVSALAAASVTVTPVTLEQDVRSALSKVRLGEVDSALVYTTDIASAASEVEGVSFPESANAITTYPIAVVAQTTNTTAARAFVSYVSSAQGQSVLSAAGFGSP